MAATVTLSTTTFTQPVLLGDTQVLPASLTGVTPGVCFYIDRELMRVVDPTLPGGWVRVLRGQAGTGTTPHGTNVTVTLGRQDQFYDFDPIGMPPPSVPVQPWINLLTGAIWSPQGDEEGSGVNARYWRQITTTYGVGALGVRTATINPTFSGVAT